jgi:Ca-activated chloride channel family protein
MKDRTALKPLAIAVAGAVILVGCMATDTRHDDRQEKDATTTNKKLSVGDQRLQDSTASVDSHSPSTVPAKSKPKAVEEQLRRRDRLSKAEAERKAQFQPGAVMLQSAASPSLSHIRAPSEPVDRENYKHFDDNPVKRVVEQPVSTFSIDVDTGAYANVRRFLNQGRLPQEDAVRVEELVNYFNYDYPQPQGQHPFSITTELSPTPWNRDTLLLHVGIQGQDVAKQTLPPANLVFLVDVSGSMQSANKLALLKTSLKLLTKQLRPQDKVSLVVYAGATGVVLSPTAGDQHATISQALDQLTAGGRTNGAAGIKLAYQMAEQAFVKGGINRVILATDGDFNVGTVSFEALIDMVEAKRKGGVSLTTLGFGMGNYNDHLMEQLGDAGNGNYAYIDTLNEAQKVLVDEMSSTLNTIAKDVKIQIEFNPAQVAEYRLVGYENRMLRREDFNNDKIDAGEIGAGHSVTALYEISLAGGKGNYTDELRYGKIDLLTKSSKNHELAFLRLRYKQPAGDKSTLIERPLMRKQIQTELAQTSDRFRFSAAVAAFGQQLRGADYLRTYQYDDIRKLAQSARGKDPFGYRGEFLKLVNLADSLSGR